MFNSSFSNKTQLKIKNNFYFILLDRTRFNAFLTLDQTRSARNSGECLHCSLNSGAWYNVHVIPPRKKQQRAALLNLRHSHNLWWVLLVKNCVFCLTKQHYMWLQVNLTHSHNTKWPLKCVLELRFVKELTHDPSNFLYLQSTSQTTELCKNLNNRFQCFRRITTSLSNIQIT